MPPVSPNRPLLSPPGTLRPGQPATVLAPMQDVTDLPFLRVIGYYGPPDWFFTEYFRVHSTSILDRPIVASIVHHGTGRPIFAQMIGESLPDLARSARALEALPIAGVDLNLGCPAPKVYKKNVGGGLLRDPEKIAEIFACLRATVQGRFTVKMRIGFEDERNYDTILDLVRDHGVDQLTVHGRTVKQLYRGDVDYPAIAHAVRRVPCPVLANGNVSSASKAVQVIANTGAAGVMIGRAAIRNPWIFRQCREFWAGEPVFRPTLADVRGYLERLWEAQSTPGAPEFARVARLKKFLNFVGQSVDAEGAFLHAMRRARNAHELMAVADSHLVADGRADLLFADEPYAGVIARPNCEDPAGTGASVGQPAEVEEEQTCAL